MSRAALFTALFQSDRAVEMSLTCARQLVLLFALSCVSLSDDFRLDLHRHLNKETLQKLDLIHSSFPIHCRSQGMKIKALDLMGIAANAKIADRILIGYQVLHHISNIYRTNVSSIHWNKNDMEKFEVVLHRQIEELKYDLQVRLSKSKGTKKIRISKYFAKIGRFLKNKEYSLCAWEHIRIKTRRTIENISKLLE
ncbi:interferon beta-2-like [Mobula hypostoma]|uniref:interferon beta-2-like n=1 Tax=Mobula hypostoma TaxID=723540 RepID=UPI002FC31A58